MNRLHRSFALIIVMSLTPVLGLAKPKVYSGVPLLGTQETPPNNSLGFGALTAIYDEDTNRLYYEFEWQLTAGAEATAVHFHGPATFGQSAAPVITLGPISGNAGKETGMVDLTEPQENQLKSGLWYLNIHSDQFPAGEIRGQLIEMSPLETATFYDPVDQRLNLEAFMLPTLGVFELKLSIIGNRSPLSFELDEVQFKDLSGDND
jgi:hypothetical protein